jgi:hypothetical protein
MSFRSPRWSFHVDLGKLALLAAGSMFGLSTLAQSPPTDPGISVPSPFDSSPPSLTEGIDANAYVVYPFKLVNNGGSALNSIRITGSVTVEFFKPDGFAAAFDTISSSPLTCRVTSSSPTVIGFYCEAPTYSLPAGQTLTVPIAFKAPTERTSTNKLAFTATVAFREGGALPNGGNSDSVLAGSSLTLVAAAQPNSVAAVVPLQTGATFFTGTRGIPQGASDNVGTVVTAPRAMTSVDYANAAIFEEALAACPVSNGKCTDKTTVSIKDKNGDTQRFGPYVSNLLQDYLVITLRRDASAFKGSVNNIIVYYRATPTDTPVQVYPCANVEDPLSGPGAPARCIYDRRVYKKSDRDENGNRIDPNLIGDAELRVIATENGEFLW